MDLLAFLFGLLANRNAGMEVGLAMSTEAPRRGGEISLLAKASDTLVPIARLKLMLAKETSVERLKEFSKQVEAARSIDNETEERCNYWGRLAVWTERRLGEVLHEGRKRGEIAAKGGDRKSISHAAILKLPDLGISLSKSSRAQKLAEIPEKEIESHLANMESNGQVTKAGVMRAAGKLRQKKKGVAQSTVNLWFTSIISAGNASKYDARLSLTRDHKAEIVQRVAADGLDIVIRGRGLDTATPGNHVDIDDGWTGSIVLVDTDDGGTVTLTPGTAY